MSTVSESGETGLSSTWKKLTFHLKYNNSIIVLNVLHLTTFCRESSISATGSIIVFSSKLRFLLVLFFIRALEGNCIVPSFPDTPVDRNKIVSFVYLISNEIWKIRKSKMANTT